MPYPSAPRIVGIVAIGQRPMTRQTGDTLPFIVPPFVPQTPDAQPPSEFFNPARPSGDLRAFTQGN